MATVTVGSLTFELEWKGSVINKPADWPQPRGYLSYPSVMLDDDRYKMWFAGWPHDWIYFAESANPFGIFDWKWKEQSVIPGPCHPEVPSNSNPSDPTVCVYPVKRSNDYKYVPCSVRSVPSKPSDALTLSDSWMTADPSVLRVVVDDEKNKSYYMWYTGTSFAEVHNAIFFAESTDGKTWTKKYRKVLTPAGKVGLCAPFLQPQSPAGQDRRGGYGMGQSSVIQLPDRFYHYLTDKTVPDGESVVRLIRMTGPFSVEGWPPEAVPGLGGNETYQFTSWDVKYYAPMHRMIAFNADFDAPDFGPLRSGLRISVSEPLNMGHDAARTFAEPVIIPIENLGVSGSNINNGGLLGDASGWIVSRETAFYCGFGSNDPNSWTIGAFRVRISNA